MRIALTVFLVLVSAQAGLGQLSDTLSGSIGPGEYHVVDTIIVPPGETLRIMPPTTLIFDGPYPFYIYGVLLAEGSESDSIVFTTDTLANPDRWRGLRFYQPGSSGSRLEYCLIEYARQPDDGGGGIYCETSSPSFRNCRISSNSTTGSFGTGGGVLCRNSGARFTGCRISNNFTTGSFGNGGGVYCQNSEANFTGCHISSNSTTASLTEGGGVHCDEQSSPNLTFASCTLSANSATFKGGGIRCNASSPSLMNCIISGNSATGSFGEGGGVSCDFRSPTFINCIISGNLAQSEGGGVHCSFGASPTFRNCTIVDNSATWGSGGGVHCRGSSPTLNSTIIVFSPSGTGIYFEDSPACTVKYCDIFGNSNGDISFENGDLSHGPPGVHELVNTNVNADSCDAFWNIFLDPMFVNIGAGDFHLDDYSRCISAAEADGPNQDIEGNPRPNPPRSLPDIGAYENEHCGPPSAFSLISPPWNDTCWTLETVLVWQTALDPDDTVSYEVWLDTLSDLSTASELVSGYQDTVFPLVELSDDYAYYWTVHASDMNTPGTWTKDTLMFHTYYPEPPGSFPLAAPMNGDTVDTATPTLQWFKASDPDSGDRIRYRLVWSYDADFGISESTMVDDTSFTFPEDLLFSRSVAKGSPMGASRHKAVGLRGLGAVEDDSTIYWKVRAIDRFDLATWCEPREGWSFHIYVEQPPDSFALLSPANGDTLDTLAVTLVWGASRDPDPGDSVVFYRVYLALDSAFTAGIDSHDVSDSDTTVDWNNLEVKRTYWWHVKAVDSRGKRTLSNQTWNFRSPDWVIPGEVVISEIFPDPESQYDGAEFIELYNTTDSTIDLSGWQIAGTEYEGTCGGEDFWAFPLRARIQAHGYLVVAKDVDDDGFSQEFGFNPDFELYDESFFADEDNDSVSNMILLTPDPATDYSDEIGLIPGNGYGARCSDYNQYDALYLYDGSGEGPGNLIDAIEYWDPANCTVEPCGDVPGSPFDGFPAVGMSLGRDSLNTDTDNTNSDFIIQEPTPGRPCGYKTGLLRSKIPVKYGLAQNYPNPFNPVTEIKYALPKHCEVKLEIFNILGQKIATLVDEKQKAGYKTARWDAGSLSSGIYFYRLQVGDFVQTRKMVLIR